MDPPGDHNPTRVIQKVKIVPMEAIEVEAPVRGRAEQEIVILARWRVAVGRMPQTMGARMRRPENRVVQAARLTLVPHVEAMHQADLSERPFANQARCFGKERAAALLQAYFDQPATTPGLGNQNGAFFDGVADGFLQVNVFPGAHRVKSGNGVPVIWSRDDHGVDVVAFEKATKIGVDVRWR